MKPSRPFVQSQYLSSVFTSASGSACAVKVAFGWQYALQPSQPLPVSHASKNFMATSLIDMVFSFSWSLLPRIRLEAELLAAHTGLEHEASLAAREDRHAILVAGVFRGTCLRRHGADLRGERQRSVLEIIERRSRLEEDDLRVGLPT